MGKGILGGRRLGLVALVVAALIVVPVALVVLSQPAASANTVLSILSGTAQVARGQAGFGTAADGDILAGGDRVRTGAASYALITFFDGSTLEVEPTTTVTVTAAVTNANGSITIQITQTIGRTWASVQKLARADSKFEIITPTSTAAVRGTAFLTEVDRTGATSVQTTDGTVEVSAQGQTVAVTAGQITTVQPGAPPTQPVPGPPPPNKLRFGMFSPAYLAVVDPQGRTCGIVLPGPRVVRQIPGCLASDPGTEPQLVDVPNAPAGTYSIVIASVPPGGSFTATASAVDGAGNLSFDYAVSGAGQPGAQFGSEIDVRQGPGGTLTASGIGALTVLRDSPVKVVVLGSPSPAPTVSGTPDPLVFRPLPSATPSPSAVATPTPTPSPSPTPTASPSPTPTPTPTPTAPPPPTPTPTPLPTLALAPPTPRPTITIPPGLVLPGYTPTPPPATPTPSPTPFVGSRPTPTPAGSGVISGVVTFDSSSPAPGVVVDAFPSECGWPSCTRAATATTTSNGGFALTGLADEGYRLRLTKSGYPLQWVGASDGVWMVGCFDRAGTFRNGDVLDGPYSTPYLDPVPATCVTIDPPSGSAGTLVTVTGEGFEPGASVSVTFNESAVALTAPMSVGSDTRFVVSFTVPAGPSGCSASIDVTAGESTGSGTLDFRPCIDAGGAYVVQQASVSGYGWPAGATLSLTLDGAPLTTTAPLVVGADGYVAGTFTMPELRPGTYTVTASDGTTTVSSTTEIYPP